MIRKLQVLAAFAVLSGCAGGGPGESEIEDALQRDYVAGVEEQLQRITRMVGEERAKEAVFSQHGISSLSDLQVTELSVEDVRETGTGDYLAKTVYTLRRGDREQERAARLTLTQLEGEWRLIDKEFLD
ncbi:MAG: hypothetical protein ACX93N_07600 [Pseudohaliea sp.]